MKTSNIIILVAALFVAITFIGAAMQEKYVTEEEFIENQKQGIKTLEANLYNYQTKVLDEPFTAIYVLDTLQADKAYLPMLTSRSNFMNVRWVKSPKFGVKTTYGKFLKDFRVRDGQLQVYINMNEYPSPVIVYAPSLKVIRSDRSSVVLEMSPTTDTLLMEATNGGIITLNDSVYVPGLKLKLNNALANIQLKKTTSIRADLKNNAVLTTAVKSCDHLNLTGDSTSSASVNSPSNSRDRTPSIYNLLTFNPQIKNVTIANTTVNQINGFREKLTLNMPIPLVEKTLKAIR